VLFASAYVPDLLRLDGDTGAQSVLREHGARLVRVETDDEGVTLDADTPAALAALRRRAVKA
jgi:molybdenum cofactor cytidylyltransferase